MQERLETSGPGSTPRAPRYLLPLPLSVRAAGEPAWHDGTIANASRTGILFFVADVSWPPETAVELRFRLATGRSESGLPVTCEGVVVRSTDGQGQPSMAAKISAYRFGGASDDAGAVQHVESDWLEGDLVSRKESR